MANEVRLRVDLGLSYVEGVDALAFASALRECLLTVGADLVTATDGVLHDAQPVQRIEVHWDVPDSRHSLNRPVPAAHTVHFDRLGHENEVMHRSGSYAEEPAVDEFTMGAANELICRGLEYVALNSGLNDPDEGLADIEAHLSTAVGDAGDLLS